MAITTLNPYLFFNGNAAEAIKLYERALGAVTEAFQRYGEVGGAPDEQRKVPEEMQKRIIHASLRVGDTRFMVSDTVNDTRPAEGNVDVVLQFDDPDDMKQRFEALSAGGRVTLPLHDTFWNATFGTLTDAYGIRWMFNYTKPG